MSAEILRQCPVIIGFIPEVSRIRNNVLPLVDLQKLGYSGKSRDVNDFENVHGTMEKECGHYALT